jgi:hypothetical protein
MNTYVGNAAGFGNNGSLNTFMGANAGLVSTTEDHCCNTFIGACSGCNSPSGSDNTFVGFRTGLVNKSFSNVFIGSTTGTLNTDGYCNTFVGRCTGYCNTTGFENVLLGANAGFALQTGCGNVFIGNNAGWTSWEAQDNTIIGKNAGSSQRGAANIAIGFSAGASYISTGSIFIGPNSVSSAPHQRNEIVIGSGSIGNGSNTTTIGNSFTTSTYLRGTLITSGSVAQQVTGSFLVTGSANINGFAVYPQVSASLNFVDDAAAAAGGVPLGGLYRNENFILIRLT